MQNTNNQKVKRGQIYFYDFGTNEGSIQNGYRPVLVIQSDDFNEYSPTTVVAAITTAVKKTYLPSHIYLGESYGLSLPSMVMLEQIRTVNQDDLYDFIGQINDDETLNQITKGLKKTFGLWFYNTNRKGDIRCLCPKCLADYKQNKNFIISRVNPLKREKDHCDKCRNYGYDYFIVDKSQTH